MTDGASGRERPGDTRSEEAWVSIPSEEEARARLQGASPAYDFGVLTAIGRLLMSHPRLGRAFGELYGAVMFAAESALDRREREMVAAVAAAAQDCFY